MQLKNLILGLSLGLAALTTGCTSKAHLQTPEGFAKFDDKTFDSRVASTGVVVGVRSHDNNVNGNLDFWTETLGQGLEARSYKLVDEAPRTVRTAHGLTGRQLRYVVESNGRKNQYWLTLFVTEKKVYVVEAGGDAAYFNQKIAPKVESAIEGLQVDG